MVGIKLIQKFLYVGHGDGIKLSIFPVCAPVTKKLISVLSVEGKFLNSRKVVEGGGM